MPDISSEDHFAFMDSLLRHDSIINKFLFSNLF